MHRSKLETYVDILGVLARDGPLRLAQLMYKANIGCSVPNEKLEFLKHQNLVEEKTMGKKRIAYTITRRGTTVLEHFGGLKSVGSKVEKSHGKHSHKDRFSNVQSQERNMIGNFIRALRAAGGVMDTLTYLDLIKEAQTEMNLDQIEDAKLLSIRTHLEEMGHIRRTTDTGTELWVLTLEGLKYAETAS